MDLITLLFHDIYISDPEESGFSGAVADRYKITATTFDRHLEALDRTLTAPPVLVTEAMCINQPQTPVAITVDDGGVSYHSIIASRLEERGWRGHCFVTTSYIGRRGFLDKHHLRDLHARGHIIGSHSVSHLSHMEKCDPLVVFREWSESRKALEDILGSEVTCASVPGGYYSRCVAQIASKAGLINLFTSEPDKAVQTVERCMVMGRFAVRSGSSPEYVKRLARGDPAILHRELRVWKGKKALKLLFGRAYPLLGEYAHRVRSGGSNISRQRQLISNSHTDTEPDKKT